MLKLNLEEEDLLVKWWEGKGVIYTVRTEFANWEGIERTSGAWMQKLM